MSPRPKKPPERRYNRPLREVLDDLLTHMREIARRVHIARRQLQITERSNSACGENARERGKDAFSGDPAHHSRIEFAVDETRAHAGSGSANKPAIALRRQNFTRSDGRKAIVWTTSRPASTNASSPKPPAKACST